MAYVLSSVSGNLISAASAGFAPTNSADVSAIASAYQVVSSTATQLYAGTAYVTSVNDAPVSAARAGNAANASLATSAYYDGTGRLISALPDSADVSAIASAYAESAASGKVDSYNDGVVDITAKGMSFSGASGVTARYNNSVAVLQNYPLQRMYLSDLATTTGVYVYPSGISGNGGGNWQYGTSEYDKLTSVYDTVSGNSASWGSGDINSAACSAIASSYAESAASSKLDSSASSSFYGIDNPSGFLTAAYTPTFGYNTANQISSIDGSALGGMDDAAVSAIASAYAESAVSSVSGNYYTTANESGFLTAQAQASWSESASASPSYIQDKPDLVDIVAGPGIVVDNPDGNTLRVSLSSNEEVELWSDAAGAFTATLSESLFNFEKIKVFQATNSGYSIQEFYTRDLTGNAFTIGAAYIALSNQIYIFSSVWSITDNGTKVVSTTKGYGIVGTTSSITYYGNNQYNGKICRVVGINRISGGN